MSTTCDIDALKTLTVPGLDQTARDQLVDTLCEYGITTFDQLWARIGDDFDEGITLLAHAAGVDAAMLTKLLAARAEAEITGSTTDWFQDRWRIATAAWRSVYTDVQAHGVLRPAGRIAKAAWSIWPVFVVPLVGVLLILRAWGYGTGWLASPMALHAVVWVAARDIPPNVALAASDMYAARLPSNADYLQSTEAITGLMSTRALPVGKPLRTDDVRSPQLVATTHITAGHVITSTAISTTWATFQRGVATKIDEVVGKQATYAIEKGATIRLDFLTQPHSDPPVTVVKTSADLPAYHYITADDVEEGEGARNAGVFARRDDVVGRFTLQPLERGATVSADDISTACTRDRAASEWRIVAIPVEAVKLMSIVPGTCVSLLFALEADQPSASPAILDDVTVVAVNTLERQGTFVVVMTATQLEEVGSFLGSADVFVIQVPP